jgi:hypothetical protein
MFVNILRKVTALYVKCYVTKELIAQINKATMSFDTLAASNWNDSG